MDGHMDGWMDIKVLINKKDGEHDTNMSCMSEDAAEATGGLIYDETQKDKRGLFTQSRSGP